MVSLNFNDFFFILNPTLSILCLWFLFFKLNSTTVKVNQSGVLDTMIIKINPNSTLVGFYLYLVILSIIGTYTLRGKNDLVWFNHFNFNNFTLNLLYLFSLMCFILFFILKISLGKTNLVKSIDYLFSINNLSILLPYLFFVNTLFTFLFLLELVSTVLLYKLVSSKIWFKNNNKTKYVKNNIPQNYINMVFFQYWVTFLSTIFIVYFYINIFYIYGTTEWLLLQCLVISDSSNNSSSNNTIWVLVVLFSLSICFKLGVTPFHLFKIEVYKGIPFLSVFFYTTYYFSILFILFLYVLSDFLIFFSNYYILFMSTILLFGSFFMVILLFDVSFLKAFFTYSTVINTVGFLVTFFINF